jgi:hypothetical protein
MSTTPIPWRNSNPPPNATSVAAIRVSVAVYPTTLDGHDGWTAVAEDSMSGETFTMTEPREAHWDIDAIEVARIAAARILDTTRIGR